MAPEFRFTTPPFDGLAPAERALVRAAAVPVAFARGSVLLTPERPAEFAWLLTEGQVQFAEAGEVIAVYGPDNVCAARAMLAGQASGEFTALDEVRAWQIPRATWQALITANSEFSAWLFGDLSRRLSAAAKTREQREMLSLVTARVRDAFVRKPFYVDGAPDLVSACCELCATTRPTSAVRDGERAGHLHHHRPARRAAAARSAGRLAVREVAHFELIGVAADAEVFDALWLMVRHRVHRLVVREGERRCVGAAGPARPGELRRQPLAHRRAADRRGAGVAALREAAAAHRRADRAAARRRHPHRARSARSCAS